MISTRPPVGRFAPSPSGPLHFGSVVAAVASFLSIRQKGGRWLVRIDDLDPPREVPGAADDILRVLEALGLEWDGAVLYQSKRLDAYIDALGALEQSGATFACSCSRSQLTQGPYPGTCRDRPRACGPRRAIRVRVARERIVISDLIQGPFVQDLAEACGDFVVRRADGVFAYHLAVVVDDAFSDVSEVVRGADLLDSTPRQVYLQRLLGLPSPHYAHVPVVLANDEQKLSKQAGARAVQPEDAPQVMFHALRFLALAPPHELAGAPCAELLTWARAHARLQESAERARSYPGSLAAANIARNSR